MERNTLLGICKQLGYRFKTEQNLDVPWGSQENLTNLYGGWEASRKLQQIADRELYGEFAVWNPAGSQGDPFP